MVAVNTNLDALLERNVHRIRREQAQRQQRAWEQQRQREREKERRKVLWEQIRYHRRQARNLAALAAGHEDKAAMLERLLEEEVLW